VETYLLMEQTRGPNDSLNGGTYTYSIRTRTGTWKQEGNDVHFSREDELSADTPPAQRQFDGHLQGTRMQGTYFTFLGNAITWVATRIVETGDQPPQVLLAEQPPYPDNKTLFGTLMPGGTVTLRVRVLANGDVGNVEVVKASKRYYGEAARDGVLHWKFLPRLKAGQPVNSTVELSISFKPEKRVFGD